MKTQKTRANRLSQTLKTYENTSKVRPNHLTRAQATVDSLAAGDAWNRKKYVPVSTIRVGHTLTRQPNGTPLGHIAGRRCHHQGDNFSRRPLEKGSKPDRGLPIQSDHGFPCAPGPIAGPAPSYPDYPKRKTHKNKNKRVLRVLICSKARYRVYLQFPKV